ncbi:MAG: hypothetical protein GY870_14455 [archaeon]|nr:hypothetical protein [archaeon]
MANNPNHLKNNTIDTNFLREKSNNVDENLLDLLTYFADTFNQTGNEQLSKRWEKIADTYQKAKNLRN